jgi:glycosyltransferase involved in cell wall biosynthesis
MMSLPSWRLRQLVDVAGAPLGRVVRRPPRIAVLRDFPEEQWPSMDLVGEMLLAQLRERHPHELEVLDLCPRMTRRVTRLPGVARTWSAHTADRLLNRFWDYPRLARAHREMADVFHVVDHSYSQLVHELPAERTVVTCHDLDTFRCLIEPSRERRSLAFRAMMRRTLGGLRKAAIVTCDTAVVRDELIAHGLVAPDRLRVVHNGVHPACSPEPDAAADAAAAQLLGPEQGALEILHVGSTAPRKGIDVLLRIVAAVRASMGSRVRLVRVGGPLTADQQTLARRLGIADVVVSLPFLSRPVLAAVYRRASVVLVPSRAEGFGLPVVEAMACGAAVVASDLAALRETGGNAATYCPVGDVREWHNVIVELLLHQNTRVGQDASRRRAAVEHASQFSWRAYARQMESIYAELLAGWMNAYRARVLEESHSRSHRLRVLHVGKFYPPVRGGMETHLQTICVGLQEYVDVCILVANTRLATSVERMDDLTVIRSASLGTLAGTPLCPSMTHAIRQSGAEIVHLHHPNPTAALAYLASGHAGPLVVTYHSDIVRQRKLAAMIAPLIHRMLARASAIVCTSPHYIESSPILRRHASRCHVLPFAVPTDAFDRINQIAVAQIRRRYGTPLVLGVGRQVGYKGFEYLVAAMRRVDGTLLLIGDGPEHERLARLASQYGISNRVHLVAGIDDAVPYYHAADVFVLPSIARSEAFGLVQLEAMASGTPVVNTALDSGVPYVSQHDVTGLTVPPAEPEALAGAIATLLENPDLRARYGAAGRRRVAERFGVRAMVERTAALYAQVADIRPVSRGRITFFN